MNCRMLADICLEGSKLKQLSSIVLISDAMELDWKGQCPYNISQRITPTDHTSALAVQASPLNTSGAMYRGEPSIVLVMPSMPNSLLNPKSANLKFPSFTSIFSGLRSRCMILWFLSILSPSTNCRKISKALFSSNAPSCCSSSYKLPPSQYSQTKQQLFLVCSNSQKRTTCADGCKTLWMASSLLMYYLTLTFSVRMRLFITFTAYIPPFSKCRALKTSLKAPRPISSPNSQSLTIRRTCTSALDLFSIAEEQNFEYNYYLSILIYLCSSLQYNRLAVTVNHADLQTLSLCYRQQAWQFITSQKYITSLRLIMSRDAPQTETRLTTITQPQLTLTLEHINKTLNRWMNKQQKRDIEQDCDFPLASALETAFKLLKDIFENIQEENYKFQEVLNTYMSLFLSTGNNQHRYLIEQHLKQVLQAKNYEKYKLNKKYYKFLSKMFCCYPFLLFRLLQACYDTLFSIKYEEVITLYELYIWFANTRKNEKLLEDYIQKEIKNNSRTDSETLDKLNILLLKSYTKNTRKLIHDTVLKQILKIITRRNDAWNLHEKEQSKLKILNFCTTLFHIHWPPSLRERKPNIMLDMVRIWEAAPRISTKQKKTINAILASLEIKPDLVPAITQAIKQKITEKSNNVENFALNCEFAKIMLSKFDAAQSETVLSKKEFVLMIDQVIDSSNYNCSEKIELLEVLRGKQIYELQDYISKRLEEVVRQRFTHEFDASFHETHRLSNAIFALRICRLYHFENENVIYCEFKKHVLKNRQNKQCAMELKRQILLVCLYFLKHKRFASAEEERLAFTNIIDLIGQELELKILMIDYLAEHLSDRFYNQQKLYLVYRQAKYEYLLYEDYATNNMKIKIFSIKTICYLATHLHNEYTFFLKNAYYQIYERIAIQALVTPEEKETCLNIIHEIMRHRAELFENEAEQLAKLLLHELHKSIEFHSPQTNTISVFILMILQDLMKKMPLKMVSYVRSLGHYIINILNFKIIKKELKRIALDTFCEVIDHCHYVILPYFHFPQLYGILREVLRNDDHYYYYQTELLRLIGRLGYVNEQEFVGLQVLIDKGSKIDEHFMHIFRQTTFLKEMKDKQYLEVEGKSTMVEDAFYSQEKVANNCVEIQNYRYNIFNKIMKNVTLASLDISLTITLKTILNIIPVLTQHDDQQNMHQLLFQRFFDVDTKFTAEVLNIVMQLLRFHDLRQRCKTVLQFYLPKVYNHRRELDLIKMLCVLTDKYRDYIDTELVDIIIVVKKISLENLQARQEEYKVRLCFSILNNLADKIDSSLHLFFLDINKFFARSHETKVEDSNNEREGRNTSQPSVHIPQSISSHYFTLVVSLAKHCPSMQYFLPSIRQCLIGYFQQEMTTLRQAKDQSLLSRKFLYKIINTMICMMVVYGRRCESFISILQWNIKQHGIYHIFYNISEEYFKKHSNLDYLHCAFTEEELNELFFNQIKTFTFDPNTPSNSPPSSTSKIIREIERLSIDRNLTEEQQDLWLDNLALQLFVNSSEEILRACCQLVQYDKLFSYDLFDVPFYFFWISLNAEEGSKLTIKIKNILTRKDISLRIRQKLLDTIYFLERNNVPFLVKDKILSDVAIDVEDQVKALFYLEREYETDPDTYREALIYKYAQIGEEESSLGLLKVIKFNNIRTKRLYLKLSQKIGTVEEVIREVANSIQKEKEKEKKEYDVIYIELKRDIFDWESINTIITKEMSKPQTAQTNRARFAHLAIEASINLGKWEQVKSWTQFLDEEHSNEETNLWLTMLNIHEKKYEEAEKLIVDIRANIYYKIRQMFNFSYEKSMKGVLILQQICEVEEVLDFKKYARSREGQERAQQQVVGHKRQLVLLWNDRLEGFKKNLYSMQKILFIRSLLLTKTEDFDNWVTFCKLALKQNNKKLGMNTLKILKELNVKDELKGLELFSLEKQLQIAQVIIKHEQALNQIQQLIEGRKYLEDKRYHALIFEIYHKYSLNIIEDDNFNIEKGNNLIKILRAFAKHRDYYELAHIMGLTHIKILEIITEEDKRKVRTERKMTLLPLDDDHSLRKDKEEKSMYERRQEHILGALRCFLKSVTNSSREHKFFLEDCLKILNLISMGNEAAKLIEELNSHYKKIPSEGLIEIIPQIIARLDNHIDQNKHYVEIMRNLLVYVGSKHPQALLFPLIFLRRGNNQFKKELANAIYDDIAQNNHSFESLYGDGKLIVQELCKISLKLSEKVFIFMNRILKTLEEKTALNRPALASKIIAFCERILEETEKLSSQSEFGFIQKEKENITLIIEYLTCFRELDEPHFFRKAVELIRSIVSETRKTLIFIKMIYLEEASVQLFDVKQSKVCLFGTYQPHAPIVRIDSFQNQIHIIASKQRPKKLVILGTDGKQYNYLLKGKEDLRLDERIMQLFSFINKMFHSPSERENYSIQGYSITPINFEIGVIAWVQNCDTIGDIVSNYRTTNNALPKYASVKFQVDLCHQLCPSYASLDKYHKVEIFREVEQNISGDDLKNIFWRRAVSSEKWLKSRSCFTRSLAVMSIVGYIIGLGDRHPFNIMLQRDTGKIVHIDFGDCFEVNKMRRSFPERVPFRLTRMLVNAMGACKTEGIFKQTCEKIMKILRSYKESVLVIVQAFRYDPLIGWKLTAKGDKGDEIMLQHLDVGLQGTEGMEEGVDEEEKKKLQSTKHILNNIKDKLHGKENGDNTDKKALQEAEQVERLIKEAMSPENLVQHWEGWCIFW